MSDLLAYYNEVKANATWYQLNSDFKDPMYQYMFNLTNALYSKIKPSIPISNYKEIDAFTVNYRNETLQYGSYECSAPGKQASMDSWFSCLLFQIPFFLEKIQLGYIGFVFVLLIMLISIFGGIKESYRWFILNQAIWDAFLCYDFICAKPTLLGWSPLYQEQNTCFYRDIGTDFGTFQYFVKQGFRIFLRNASFIPVFHLALSRYICMYFPGFYKKFTKNGYKIFVFIVLFNVICMTIFCFAFASLQAIYTIAVEQSLKCNEYCPSRNSTYCYQNVPQYFQCTNRINISDSLRAQLQYSKIFKFLSYSIPPIMFFLSILCAAFLFSKIATQLQFQLKTNRESFKQTIKISSVVGFQCITMSIIFITTGIQKFMQIKSVILETYFVYDDLPTWLLLLQYYTTTASLNMLRIILDSYIVLTVLSGYSSCIISTIKFLWLCFTNPKAACKKIKHNVRSSNVTVISISPK